MKASADEGALKIPTRREERSGPRFQKSVPHLMAKVVGTAGRRAIAPVKVLHSGTVKGRQVDRPRKAALAPTADLCSGAAK